MPKHLGRIAVTAVAAGMLLLSASWAVAAANHATSAFPVLRTIMRDMGRNMQVIGDAIAREDWARVARTTALLVDRPQPSMSEKFRLLGFLGTNAAAFRGYDKQTRHAVQALERAAMRGDDKAVIAAFVRLEGSCLGCHRDFRKPFQEAFLQQP